MNFDLLSKNSLGCVAILLLVILLCQSRLLDLLFDTILGRTILVLFILLIAHTNKILGVVAVLIIIIAFNNSYTSMVEGFDASGNSHVDVSGNTITGSKGNTATISKGNTTVTNSSGETATAGTGQIAQQLAEQVKTKLQSVAGVGTGTEGFDLIGMENNIKRGKQSNSIPVNSYVKESDNISAFDGLFSNGFSKI
jgi:hypothetical protein